MSILTCSTCGAVYACLEQRDSCIRSHVSHVVISSGESICRNDQGSFQCNASGCDYTTESPVAIKRHVQYSCSARKEPFLSPPSILTSIGFSPSIALNSSEKPTNFGNNLIDENYSLKTIGSLDVAEYRENSNIVDKEDGPAFDYWEYLKEEAFKDEEPLAPIKQRVAADFDNKDRAGFENLKHVTEEGCENRVDGADMQSNDVQEQSKDRVVDDDKHDCSNDQEEAKGVKSNGIFEYLPSFDLLVCKPCKLGFNSGKSAYKHCKSVHLQVREVDKDLLGKHKELSHHWPTNDFVQGAVPQLKIVKDGYRCLECNYCVPQLNSMKTHITNYSHDNYVGGQVIQTLCSGNLQAYRPVISDAVEDTIASDYMDFYKKSVVGTTYGFNSVPVVVKPWEKLFDHDFRRSKAFLCVGGKNYDQFEIVMRQYFDMVQKWMDKIPYKARTLLVASDLLDNDVTIVTRRGFRKLQEDQTIKKYCKYATQLLIYILKKSWSEELDTSITSNVDQLQREVSMKTVHDVLSSFIKTKYELNKELHALPIMEFLVLSNMDHGFSVLKATSITQKLSMLMFLFRAVILMEYYEFKKTNDFDGLLQFVKVKENHTPFSIVVEEKALLSAIANEEDLGTSVQWSDMSCTSLVINGSAVSIVGLRELVKILTSRCDCLISCLTNDLKIEFPPLEDDLRCQQVGYSFVAANAPFFEKLSDSFYRNTTKEEFGLFQDGLFVPKKASEWLRNYDRLCRYLLVLAHVTGGMPSRATELCTYVWKNTDNFSRSVYIYSNLVMFVQRYSKNSHRKGLALISRFVPLAVSALFKTFLGLLTPFAEFLHEKVLSNEFENEFLWTQNGKRMTSENICDTFSSVYEEMTGNKMKIKWYRQAIQGLAEKNIQKFEENTNFDPLNAQFDHSSSTGATYYARTSQDLVYAARDKIQKFFVLSLQWHNLLGFQEGVLAESKSTKKASSGNKKKQEPNSASTVVNITQINAIMPTGRVEWNDVSQVYEVTKSDQDLTKLSYDLVSKLQHVSRNFRFKSPEQAQFVSLMKSGNSDLLAVFPTGTGKSFAALVPSLLEDKSTVVVVPLKGLRDQYVTLCNKLGISVAKWSSQVTLSPANAPKVIVVVVECAVSELFRQFLGNLNAMNRLARVVIDECHLVLSGSDYRLAYHKLCSLRMVPFQMVLMSGTVPPSMADKLMKCFASDFKTLRNKCVDWKKSYQVAHVKKPNMRDFVVKNLPVWLKNGSIIFFMPSIEACKDICNFFTDVLKLKAMVYTSDQNEQERKSIHEDFGKTFKILFATSAYSVGMDPKSVATIVHWNAAWTMIDYIQECGRAGRDGKPAVCIILKDVDISCKCSTMLDYLNNTTSCRRSLITFYLDGEKQYCYFNNDSLKCDVCAMYCYHLKRELEMADLPPAKKLRFDESVVQKHEEKDVSGKAILIAAQKASELKPQIVSGVVIHKTERAREKKLGELFEKLKKVKSNGCVICQFHGIQGKVHGLSDCPFVSSSCCFKCLGNHKSDKCKKQKFERLCYKCALPGRLDGFVAHNDDFAKDCKLGLNDLLVPLAFLVWRNEEKRKIVLTELETNVNFTTEDNYFNYWNWLNARVNQLPNFVNLFAFCVEKKWLDIDG